MERHIQKKKNWKRIKIKSIWDKNIKILNKFKKRLQVDERLQKSYLDKRCGVGSLDNAGRIVKKSRDDDI